MIHSSSDRQAVRTVLERQFGRAIPVTEEMIDAVIDALDEEGNPQ